MHGDVPDSTQPRSSVSDSALYQLLPPLANGCIIASSVTRAVPPEAPARMGGRRLRPLATCALTARGGK